MGRYCGQGVELQPSQARQDDGHSRRRSRRLRPGLPRDRGGDAAIPVAWALDAGARSAGAGGGGLRILFDAEVQNLSSSRLSTASLSMSYSRQLSTRLLASIY